MIFGYENTRIDEDAEGGPLELKEVTFAMRPDELRLVARFLEQMATQLDTGAPFLHRHIDEVFSEWRTMHPTADIVVIPPQSGDRLRFSD